MRKELSSLTSPSHAEVSSILQSLQQLLQMEHTQCYYNQNVTGKSSWGGIGMESKVTELFVPLEGVVGGDADFIATHATGSIR